MINNRGEQQPNVESLNTITLAEIHQLYEEEKSRIWGNETWATENDYTQANNSKGLEIKGDSVNGTVWVIHRGIRGKDITVPTQDISKYQILRLSDMPGKFFVSGLLWQHHGLPCETRSGAMGGDGYSRS